MKITLQVLAMLMGSTLAVSAAQAAGAFDGCTNLSGQYDSQGITATITQTDCSSVTESFAGGPSVTLKADGSKSTDASGQIISTSWVNGQLVEKTLTKNSDGTFTTQSQTTMWLDANGSLLIGSGDEPALFQRIN